MSKMSCQRKPHKHAEGPKCVAKILSEMRRRRRVHKASVTRAKPYTLMCWRAPRAALKCRAAGEIIVMRVVAKRHHVYVWRNVSSLGGDLPVRQERLRAERSREASICLRMWPSSGQAAGRRGEALAEA